VSPCCFVLTEVNPAGLQHLEVFPKQPRAPKARHSVARDRDRFASIDRRVPAQSPANIPTAFRSLDDAHLAARTRGCHHLCDAKGDALISARELVAPLDAEAHRAADDGKTHPATGVRGQGRRPPEPSGVSLEPDRQTCPRFRGTTGLRDASMISCSPVGARSPSTRSWSRAHR